MKKAIVAVLAALNLGAAGLLIWLLTGSGHAEEGLQISDLTYGSIDADGDGQYTKGDDIAIEWLLNNNRQHVEEAMKAAKVNLDGGIDLSGYLMTLQHVGE